MRIIIKQKIKDFCPLCGREMILKPRVQEYEYKIGEIEGIQIGVKCTCGFQVAKNYKIESLPKYVVVLEDGLP